MTMPKEAREAVDAGIADGSRSIEKPDASQAEKRLGDLIRGGDRQPTPRDPALELRRRACPSGE